MYVWLILETIKFYMIKWGTDFYWQPSYVIGWKSLINAHQGQYWNSKKIQ